MNVTKSVTPLLLILVVFFISPIRHAVADATPASPTNVDEKATAGNGTKISPWTGWDGNITWAPGIPYTFRAGWYSYSSTPRGWSQSNMLLLGVPGAVLTCSNCAGSAVVSIKKPIGAPYSLGFIRFENFILDGGGAAAEGLVVDEVARSEFNNIRVQNVIQNGFHLSGNVLNTFSNPKVTDANTSPTSVTKMPLVSMLIDGKSSANTIINPIFEGNEVYQSITPADATGFKFAGIAIQNTVIGGTVEGLATGISLCSDQLANENCNGNTFSGIDLESNSKNDIVIGAASSCQFNNVLAVSTQDPVKKNVTLLSQSRSNQFIGGFYSSIWERGTFNTFMNIGIAAYPGNFDSFRISTALINVRDLSLTTASTSYSALPSNTLIGAVGSGINNAYRVTQKINGLPVPGTVPGAVEANVYINSNLTKAITGGATVSVGFDGVLPFNYILSGFVDPATPTDVKIRWTQISGPAAAPPSGTYIITVLQ